MTNNSLLSMKRPPDRRLSTEEVCHRFGISRFTLRRWHESEEVGFPKPLSISRRHYYSESDIFRWELRQQGIDPDMPQSITGYPVISGPISDYRDLVAALRKRREALKLSAMEVDARSGMQEGYTNKLENWGRPYGRGAGPDILPLWLGGVRVALVLVELPKRPRSLKKIAAAEAS
ncbi:helix-turn-helix transcriptional regulator [Rhizobium rhizogenes]|uniref:helix-turn-helix transcriptional regulator n=1 Tax=Rhizobium rhizogenes TaxID=359 RepID=UPI001F25ADB8|nr:helix-turn-helix domain-containing protein [Rhizobium rhizogenes]